MLIRKNENKFIPVFFVRRTYSSLSNQLVEFGVYDTSLNWEKSPLIHLDNYVINTNKFTTIDDTPFHAFKRTPDFTFTKDEIKQIDSSIANDAWKFPFIDKHKRINLPAELVKLDATNINGELLSSLIEKEWLVPFRSHLEYVDLVRRTKTKYYLQKDKKEIGRGLIDYDIPAKNCFLSYKEALEFVESFLKKEKERIFEERLLTIEENIERALPLIAPKDHAKFKQKATSLLNTDENSVLLCCNGQVLFKIPNNEPIPISIDF